MAAMIRNSQIIMFPGGFSGGDEPDGSGKFIATTFRNPKIMEAVTDLLENRDGPHAWNLQRIPGNDKAGTCSIWKNRRYG